MFYFKSMTNICNSNIVNYNKLIQIDFILPPGVQKASKKKFSQYKNNNDK